MIYNDYHYLAQVLYRVMAAARFGLSGHKKQAWSRQLAKDKNAMAERVEKICKGFKTGKWLEPETIYNAWFKAEGYHPPRFTGEFNQLSFHIRSEICIFYSTLSAILANWKEEGAIATTAADPGQLGLFAPASSSLEHPSSVPDVQGGRLCVDPQMFPIEFLR